MTKQSFKALVVSEAAEGGFAMQVAQRPLTELPPGEVLIRVRYSSLNYKDALSASGNRGVTRNYPHTPGIDAAGTVMESASNRFAPGDEVLVTGFDLGMNTPGGFGQYIRVPAAWPLKPPPGLDLKEAMVYGTAGLTAALSLFKLERHGIAPDQGEVLVTGASGGVGSLAVAILARAGYRVVAASGKPGAAEFLHGLGAAEVVPREQVADVPGKVLLKERWAGVVDTVGGGPLAGAIKAARYGAAVTCCGLVASAELPLTVYPFILRGVSLLGIDSVLCPMDTRAALWNKLAGEWRPAALDALHSECPLEGVADRIGSMLRSKATGRTVVDLG